MEILIPIGIIVGWIVFVWIKDIVWDKPHAEIKKLVGEVERLKAQHIEEKRQIIQKNQLLCSSEVSALQKEQQEMQARYEKEIIQLKSEVQKNQRICTEEIVKMRSIHEEEFRKLEERLKNSNSLKIQEKEFYDIALSYSWREVSELVDEKYKYFKAIGFGETDKKRMIDSFAKRFEEAIIEQYKYRYLTYLYPELSEVFNGTTIVGGAPNIDSIPERMENLIEVVDYLRKSKESPYELIRWKSKAKLFEKSKSNLSAIPYMAAIMADYETYGLENLARELDWGANKKRAEKVKAIREIRRDAQAIVEKNKEAQYQLSYLLNLFPNLEDVIDADFNQLPVIDINELSNYDSVRDYLSKEEYAKLSEVERNQLALDRYKQSHNRTKWQIGRDYEYYIGYLYTQKGYDVDYFGSYMGMEDLGRDLIAKRGEETLIIQCKYWSEKKLIHEKHINQLYGTMTAYKIENQHIGGKVKGILITNIELSPMAKKMADYLKIEYAEKVEAGDYPCIKCNVGHDSNGAKTRIYHLPFDQQYDSTKINGEEEFYAMTVAEAESAGFRRAYKWFGAL